MNPETAILQAEINRLNVIISVLVEKNQQLEQEIALLTGKPAIERPASILPQTLLRHIAGSNGIIPSLDIPEVENNILPQNVHRQEMSLNSLTKEIHRTELKEVNAYQNTVGTELIESNLPHKLHRQELVKISLGADVEKLYSLLKKQEMLQVGNNGVMNIAKTLKVLSEIDKPDYADIRKQTGQSDSGISKMIRSMKKRNLLVRTSQYKFHLTEKAIVFLREAGV
jgi:hypothetical protein